MDRTPAKKLGPDLSPVVHRVAYGGHTIDFRDFANQGMVVLGRAVGAQNGTMTFVADLLEDLAHGDAAYHGFMDFVDVHIASRGLNFT